MSAANGGADRPSKLVEKIEGETVPEHESCVSLIVVQTAFAKPKSENRFS